MKLNIIYPILLIPFGIFLFVYGGADDSPGAQLLGLLMALGGVVTLWRRK
ncbi:MAG: LPXTG cell wall anchor domain-containing protein [Patescibacteria group bacterium]